jgi:uroporphyrinogen decarboxylase
MVDMELYNLLFKRAKGRIPRGELFIAREVLKELGREQTREALVALCAETGADLCFLSYGGSFGEMPVRAEEMALLVEKAHSLGMLCGVAVDGPFERTAGEHGFLEVLRWFGDPPRLREHLEESAEKAAAELAAAGNAGADLLVLCDDVAYGRGLYFSPAQFAEILFPFYRLLKKEAGDGRPVGFHSDGNVAPVVPHLVEAGYAFFSLEPEAVPLEDLGRRLPEGVFILSGIKAQWLTGPAPEEREEVEKEIIRYITGLKNACRLVLASACGIFDRGGLERLKRIYALV